MMESKFKILISSDADYNELCAEIFFENQFVGILNQEKGIENQEIEIYPPNSQDFWIFKFTEFEKILKSAKEMLIEMRRF